MRFDLPEFEIYGNENAGTHMLKCIVISTPGAKFTALAVKEEFKDSLRKVAELGYDAVELAIRDPEMIDIRDTKSLLQQYRLPVPAIGTGQAYGEEGLSFTDPDHEIRRKAVQRIKDQMDLSVELGEAQVIIGLIRGTVRAGSDPVEAEKHFIECILECLEYNPQVMLTLEPINRYETNLYNDTRSVKAMIDKVGKPNLRMLVDTFHMNIEEPNIVESLRMVKDYISHVHFADSNRWAPGCGHIDFKEILTALKEFGYHGAISAEILPKPSPAQCLRLTMDHYHRLGL